MVAIPMWKLKRELRATYDQLVAILIRLTIPFARLKRRLFPVIDYQLFAGRLPLGQRVVVYLVFPGDKDLSDRLDAIDFLIAQDASVVCVANGILPPAWLDKFSSRCAYVLLRGNRGYDFGGYQAGVLFLNQLGHQFDHLHVINDSVLMPVVNNERVVFDIEAAADTGFGGAVALPLDKPSEAMSSVSRSPQLVLSYWLYFSGGMAKSACFCDYWLNYVPTSSKVLTVRYGERGLSRYMAVHGYHASTAYSIESTVKSLRHVSPDDMVKILQYASFTDSDFSKKCENIMLAYEPNQAWVNDVIHFIQEVAGRRNFLHSFCYIAYAILRVPFIKKTRIKLPLAMRQQYIRAVQDGALGQPSAVMWKRLLDISK